MKDQNIYYVYVYLNPFKKGNHSYMENGIGIDFKYEPFYVGAGKENRYLDHLKGAQKSKSSEGNKHKENTIKKIIRNNSLPIIHIICNNLSFTASRYIEKQLCSIIGRSDLNLGPLTNLTNGVRVFVG